MIFMHLRKGGTPAVPNRELQGLCVWTVVYVASSWEEAEKIKEGLEENGLLVQIRESPTKKPKVTGNAELLVPDIEVMEAQLIIMELVGTVRAL